MTFSVRILARARQDVQQIYDWIGARSVDGAEQWLERFEQVTETLRVNPFLCPIAPESERLQVEVRHILFRTRNGRTFRAIFTVTEDQVRILRIRGAGQPPVKPREMDV